MKSGRVLERMDEKGGIGVSFYVWWIVYVWRVVWGVVVQVHVWVYICTADTVGVRMKSGTGSRRTGCACEDEYRGL